MDDSALIMLGWRIGSYMGRDAYGIITASMMRSLTRSLGPCSSAIGHRYSWFGGGLGFTQHRCYVSQFGIDPYYNGMHTDG